MMDRRRYTMLDAISEVLSDKRSPMKLPAGVERVERISSDIIRIQFADDVDYSILRAEAIREGYRVESGIFTPRITYHGTIIARVGGESDPAKQRSIFIYLIPPDKSEMNTYRRVVAMRHGVIDPVTGRLNFQKFLEYNLKIIRLLSRYRKARYENLPEKVEFH